MTHMALWPLWPLWPVATRPNFSTELKFTAIPGDAEWNLLFLWFSARRGIQ
jgi:hypothetical protein